MKRGYVLRRSELERDWGKEVVEFISTVVVVVVVVILFSKVK